MSENQRWVRGRCAGAVALALVGLACSASRRNVDPPDAGVPVCGDPVCFELLEPLGGAVPPGTEPGCNPAGVERGRCPPGFTCIEAAEEAWRFGATGLCRPSGEAPPDPVAIALDLEPPRDGAHEVTLRLTLNGGGWPVSDVRGDAGTFRVQRVSGGAIRRVAVPADGVVTLLLDPGTYSVDLAIRGGDTRTTWARRRGRLIVQGAGQDDVPLASGTVMARWVGSGPAPDDLWLDVGGTLSGTLAPGTYDATVRASWRVDRWEAERTSAARVTIRAGEVTPLEADAGIAVIPGTLTLDAWPDTGESLVRLRGDGWRSSARAREENGGAFEIGAVPGAPAKLLVPGLARRTATPISVLREVVVGDRLDLDLAARSVAVTFDVRSADADVAILVPGYHDIDPALIDGADGAPSAYLIEDALYDLGLATRTWSAPLLTRWSPPGDGAPVVLDAQLADVAVVPDFTAHAEPATEALSLSRYTVRLVDPDLPEKHAALHYDGGVFRGPVPAGTYEAVLVHETDLRQPAEVPIGSAPLGRIVVPADARDGPIRRQVPVRRVDVRITVDGTELASLPAGADRGLIDVRGGPLGDLLGSQVLRSGTDVDLSFLAFPGVYLLEYHCDDFHACSADRFGVGGTTPLVVGLDLR